MDPVTPPRVIPQVTYWAISILNSRTFWFNAANLLVASLSLSEVTAIVPVRFMPLQAAIVAVVNMWLRTRTVRPAALIAPGTTQATLVDRIGPPPPLTVGD